MLEKAKSQSIKTGRSGHTRNIGHKTKNGDKKKPRNINLLLIETVYICNVYVPHHRTLFSLFVLYIHNVHFHFHI